MLVYVLRRVLASIPVLILVTAVTFLLLHAVAGSLVPGVDLNPAIQPQDMQRIRHDLGLDEPIYVQYWSWVSGIVRGDFGRSLIDGSPVLQLVAERLPNTLLLTGTALLVAVVVAIPMGVVGALRRGGRLDHALTVFAVSGFSVPHFWLGLLLILLFSVQMHAWGLPSLPASGATSPLGGGDVLDRLAHLAMPATVLAFGYLAAWSRFVRSSLLEELGRDYVRTAQAKGMGRRRVVYVHVLRNAVIPLVTLVGLELRSLVGGAAIVEMVFGWPGIGQLALQRALAFDYTTVMGLVTIAALLVIGGNLLADVLYAVLDPRIRLGRAATAAA